MKTIPIALTSALGASLLTAGAFELLRNAPRPVALEQEVGRSLAAAPEPGASAPHEQELVRPEEPRSEIPEQRLAELEARIAILESELSSVSRRTRVDEPLEAPLSALDPAADTDGTRDLVLQVIEEERRARERREEELRATRLEERLREQAARAAEELGLSPSEEGALLSVIREESTRREDLFRTLRESEFDPALRESVRSGMEALQTWKTLELEKRFGVELAGRISELDPGRRFGPRLRPPDDFGRRE